MGFFDFSGGGNMGFGSVKNVQNFTNEESAILELVKNAYDAQALEVVVIISKTQIIIECQTAHCGRRKPHFDFGGNTSPIVPYRHLPQTLRGLTADCRSLV